MYMKRNENACMANAYIDKTHAYRDKYTYQLNAVIDKSLFDKRLLPRNK